MKVLMAALRHGGKIYAIPRPARHSDLLKAIAKHERPIAAAQGRQGFVDEEGRFLDRTAAWWQAIAAAQIPVPPEGTEPRELFTEDLW